MFNWFLSRRGTRSTAFFSVILTAGLAQAALAPEDHHHKSSAPGMYDARVNGQDAWQRAMSARPDVAASVETSRNASRGIASALSARKRNNPGLSVRLSGITGAPTSVVNKSGDLTPRAPGKSSESIVRDYLRGSAGALMGLTSEDVNDLVVLGDSAGGVSGMRMLRVEQRVNGRPVFQSETRFAIASDGRLQKHVGLMVPRARAIAPADPVNKLSAQQASSRLFASVGKTIDDTAFSISASLDAGRIELSSTDSSVAGAITAREVYFPLAPGVLVPAWSVIAFTDGDADWYSVVDAQTGDVLWRKNIRSYASTHEARFRVYVQADGKTPADSPAPLSPTNVTPGSGTQAAAIAPTIVKMSDVQNLTASPNGWIDDCSGGVCTANQTQTLGNNVLACVDRSAASNVCDTDAGGVLDGNGRPTGNPDVSGRNRDFLGTAPRDFETGFLPPPQAGNPEGGQTATGAGTSGTAAIDSFRRAVATHLFYLANWYHDQTFLLGFDEASGNFQQTNFSGGGLGGDRVLADVQDGGGTNNANFATPPDGTSGRMQMYRFTSPTIDRDGSLDADIVLHELTHGLSNRLVGNAAGLNWDPARGLGEGWSDFYALSLLNNTNADNPNGNYAAGGYATYKLGGLLDNYLYGIRRFPYSTDINVNPLTWGDIDDVTNSLSGGIAPSPLNFNGGGGAEVHNSGEIWANTLWQVRANVIADPAGANGDVPTGNVTTLQLVTDALKMTPIDPTFIDARDALFDADCATNACANERSIWDAFAKRGLGYGADSPYGIVGGYSQGHIGIKQSFSVPFLDVQNAIADVAILDSATNNNGAIDPGESFFMTVKLFNPWRLAAKAATGVTATLTTTTPGVTIYTDTATYPTINPQAAIVGGQFKLGVASSMTAGAPIDFTLTTTSSLGTTSTTFRVRVGTRAGTDPVVVYTSTIAGGLTITSNAPRGATNTLTINDDYEIADVDFRVDSVTHPGVGDLSVLLRSPSGIGTDLIALIDGLFDIGGAAITNMVIDDDVPGTAVNDMVQATSANAPYTKSWRPVYNSPWAALVDPTAPADTVGSLSRYDGTSTKGTWTVLVADNFSATTGGTNGNGLLNGWSMLVTPVHFDVAPVAATAAVAATKTVSGTFRAGQAVSYTVVLTNTGTGNQGDNPGDEFTDVLPSGLTLVSVSATSGTALATIGTNTVTWNGALAPLGGSTTITINATINAGTQGTTISNQGTVAFDADNNGTNESTALTDDPAVSGATDPTAFTVQSAAISATKTVSGSTFAPGSTATYTVVLSNAGSTASPNNAGDEFTDVLPAGLTLVGASATAGVATATLATNTVTWNGSVGAASSVTITITATINAGTGGTTIANQGSVAFDADLNGSNESSALTDDPTVAGATNPTSFVVSYANVSGTKTVSGGPYAVGSTVTYTIMLSNSGNIATADNAGDEMVDVIPVGLSYVGASASSGSVNFSGGAVRWNGAIAAGGSVTITITTTINGLAAGGSISNQASFSYNEGGSGSNTASGVTDDPTVAGAANATVFASLAAPPVPVAGGWLLALIGLLLLVFGANYLRPMHRRAR